MKATVSIKCRDGKCTEGQSNCKILVEDEDDSKALGCALACALKGTSAIRLLLILAQAVGYLADDAEEPAETEFLKAAENLIDYYDQHDSDLNDEVAHKDPPLGGE